ncbi:hypothetical protein KPH14_011779 [Odynerus spinipes]|uniref:Peptidase S1 domain-containing protein n=1 Tax=Odynerus spinipes TaxID=1348599 RepID=A0AAD9RWH3_9HYME|nr:hypothetical protein KPH14_011779 [Odynerus spinipes]
MCRMTSDLIHRKTNFTGVNIAPDKRKYKYDCGDSFLYTQSNMAIRIFVFVLVASTTAGAASITGRIIGGKDADENAFPYQVSIRVHGYHICGGSLIDYQWILTAAHCLINHNISTMFVVVGSNSVLSGGIAYIVEDTIIHEGYRTGPIINDIGLIKIVGRFKYSDKIGPIRLPDKDIDETDCTAIFTGWGETKGSVKDDTWLQYINLHIMQLSECHKIYPSSVRDSNICTYNDNTQGVCYGDSGSPLVINGVQIGLASWVAPCAQGHPDVHTRVYSYLDWIKSHIS